jgi:PilZ domain
MLSAIVEPFHGSEIMMAVAPDPRSKTKATRFVLRPYRRMPTWLVLYYLSGECVGKGIVTNLSQSGMRIQGDHAVKPGLDLTLRVTFADDGPPIEVERATVRWVDGYDFGLDFAYLSPSAAKHISDTLNQQIRAPHSPT